MKTKPFIILYFAVILSLVIAWTNINEDRTSDNSTIIRDGHKQALTVVNPQVILPQYKTADVLLEDLGGPPVELLPANISSTNQFLHFAILEDGGTYYLWLNTSLHQDAVSQSNRPSVEQRFESQNGLIWRNRTDTNLVRNEPFKYLMGLREVLKTGGLFEGWEHYYYESSSGWGVALRYVTSNDGITWTVVNDPALIGSHFLSVAKNGGNYELWAHPDGDGNFTGDASIRYRTNTNPGSGWGNWLTGGTELDLDGTGDAPKSFTRVRKTASNTYELFYLVTPQYHLNKAISTDGINFTTVVTNMIEFNTVMPTIVDNIIRDFAVVDIGGEDWVYFTYCEARNSLGNCTDSNIAVSRPVYAEIEVLDGSTNIPDDTGQVDFGTTLVGFPVVKTFTVHNSGQGDLVLTTPITLPTGFSLVNSFGTITVPVNMSTTFEVQLDATTAGVYNGTLAFDNNDLDETPYNFTLNGTVTSPSVPTSTPLPKRDKNDDDDDDDDDDDGGEVSAPAPPTADQAVTCWPWQVIVPALAIPGAKVQCIPMLGEALPSASPFRYLGHSAEITVRDSAGVPVHQFNPPLTVCFHYTQTELDALLAGDATNFHLQTYRNNIWESLDTRQEIGYGAAPGRVCASVDHLTLFALFENSTGQDTVADSPLADVKFLPETGVPPINPWNRVIGGGLVILVSLICILGVWRWRRK